MMVGSLKENLVRAAAVAARAIKGAPKKVRGEMMMIGVASPERAVMTATLERRKRPTVVGATMMGATMMGGATAASPERLDPICHLINDIWRMARAMARLT